MKKVLRRVNTYMKGLVLWCRPYIFFGWLRPAFFFAANTLSLSKWISKQERKTILNDFFLFKRVYSKRYQLYQYVIDRVGLTGEEVDYVEFGVCNGSSLKWWTEHLSNNNTYFYGFDTFEGLPENWGTYRKGDMDFGIPEIDDIRVRLFKGLFQDIVPVFLRAGHLDNTKRKIIHLDADLFSSTLYVLTIMAPYLKKGDILFFDEFNVPNHEFLAFKMFSDSYYIKTVLLGAVNNYYQVAFMIL